VVLLHGFKVTCSTSSSSSCNVVAIYRNVVSWAHFQEEVFLQRLCSSTGLGCDVLFGEERLEEIVGLDTKFFCSWFALFSGVLGGVLVVVC
jgi:hypothetical protein